MLPVSINIGSTHSCGSDTTTVRPAKSKHMGRTSIEHDALTSERASAVRTADPASGPGSLDVIQRGVRRISDSVELMRDTRGTAGGGAEMRHDLIARVRAQIAAGEYDSSAKIEAAADRLARHLDLLA